jgi:hypothetical protein
MTVETSGGPTIVVEPQVPVTPAVAQGESPVVPSPTDTAAVDVPLDSLPASWQDHIKSLRKENQAVRKAEADRLEAEKQKQQEDDVKKGEWQKLATEREQEVNRLKPLEEQVQKLNASLLKTYKAEYDKWPDEVKATAPKGDGVTATQVEEWLESPRPLAEKLMQTTVTKPTVRPGNTTGPTPATTNNRPAGVSDQPLVNVQARL